MGEREIISRALRRAVGRGLWPLTRSTCRIVFASVDARPSASGAQNTCNSDSTVRPKPSLDQLALSG